MSVQSSTIRSGTPSPSVPTPVPRRHRAATVVLTLGALGVVLAFLGSEVFVLDRYLVPKALVLHLTALTLLLVRLPSAQDSRWGSVEWLLIGFIVWSAVSGIASRNHWLALAAWGVSFSSLVLFLVARDISATVRWSALGWLLTAVVIGALLGIAQAYGLGWDWLAGTRLPGGTFGNRNFLAHVSAIALPPLAVMALRERRRQVLLAMLLGIVALAGAVVITRSRAAWLGGAAGLATAGLVLLIAHRRRLVGLMVKSLIPASALALAAALAIMVPNRLAWRSETPFTATLTTLTDFNEGSGRGRVIQYRNSLALVPVSPVLGVGPGNWFVHYPTVTSEGDPAYSGDLLIPTNPWPSSDWVALVTERGALSVMLLLMAGALAARRALAWGRDAEGDRGYQAAALLGLLIAGLVTGLFDAVILLAAPSYLLWAAAGLLLPSPSRPLGPSVSKRGARLARGPVAVAAMLLLTLTATHAAAIAITGDQPNTATLERAARLAPGEHRLHVLLAERGNCEHARAAALLMPYHQRMGSLARTCR